MKSGHTAPKDVDEYIAGFPQDVRTILEQVRENIRKAAPEAEEKLSYGIPTFALKGNLAHFAAFKKHIGFYPAPSGIKKFKGELSAYESAKGSVQFPLDEPIPYDLIRRIAEFRVKENLENAEKKGKNKQGAVRQTTGTQEGGAVRKLRYEDVLGPSRGRQE